MFFNTLIDQIINNFDKVISIVFLLISGLGMRFVLQLFGQVWIKTKAHSATLLILPVITYVITNVISGNIALSLGMVGALSIVRFRHPVRSPLELSTYFGAIAMGISAGVSLKWAVVLLLSVILVVATLALIEFIVNKLFNRSLFIASFTEGNNLCTLTIKVNQPLEICNQHKLLYSKIKDADGITYSFASENFDILKDLEEDSEIQNGAISSELRR